MDLPRPARSHDASRFWIGTLALGLTALTLALAAFARVPTALPGWHSVTIESGSMEPAIRVGDVVVAVEQTRSDPPRRR